MTSVLALAAALALAPPAGAAPAGVTPAVAPVADRPPVILVSIDGFRADYLDRGLTPTLSALAAEGARASGMHPSFPSVTFPNHYTLVTGLRPDHHGIVHNTMVDPTIQPDSRFTIGDFTAVADGRWWAEGEPIWATAKRAGLRTATLFWPGSEAEIGGLRPDHWAHYDGAVTPDQRVDVLLDWLDLPVGKRPHFLTLYFDAVDHAGHEHGPDSPEVNRAMGETDAALARLVAGLRARRLFDTAELVIVADHGMAATSAERLLYLDDLAPVRDLRAVTLGPVAEVAPEGPGGPAALRRLLAWRSPHGRCWRKADLPAALHYGANPRIPPVVCVAQSGWMFARRPEPGQVARETPAGEHGYDPADPHMDALFVAHGPAFRRGYRQGPFDNVDVYPLLAKLLGIAPAPNDGRLQDVAGMLRATAARP